MMRIQTSFCLAACLLSAMAHAEPPGAPKSGHTKMLEKGAQLLQRTAPLADFDIYLVGFHPMKDQPEHQMEAHHYCRQVNEDLAQCVLFDGNTARASMNGVEYIISERLFASLPVAERQYWHPHNGEILSGQLMAPGLPERAEYELMKSKMNSYGKTWHVWHTGHDALPLGPAVLAWSFNRDGEVQPGLVEQRDKRIGRDTPKTRQNRADLQPLARPQSGVDDLKGKFARPSTPIPGVASQ